MATITEHLSLNDIEAALEELHPESHLEVVPWPPNMSKAMR